MRNRVFTYITRQNDLLVFDHVDHKHLQPQVPGGTIEQHEQPATAALREAYEETGLVGLQMVSCLGSFTANLAIIGIEEKIHAWFFHLQFNHYTSQRWRHFELYPSGGTDPIEFELYWMPLENGSELGGIDGAMLPELNASVTRINSGILESGQSDYY